VDLDHGDDPGMVHQNDPGTSESHTLGANQLQQAKADVAKSPEKARTPSRKILLLHHMEILSQQLCRFPAAFAKDPKQGVNSRHSYHRVVTFTSC
jgi:hypothetical protein